MLLICDNLPVASHAQSLHRFPGITCRRKVHLNKFRKMEDDDDLLLDDVNDFGVYTSTHNHLEISNNFEPDVSPFYDNVLGQDNPGVVFDGRQDSVPYRRENQPMPLHRSPIDDDTELINLQATEMAEQLGSKKQFHLLAQMTKGYCWFLAKFPYIPIIITFVMLVVFAGVSYWKHPPPDFSEDPTAGFETRGTYIRKGMSTSRRFYKSIISHDGLAIIPDWKKVMAQFGLNGTSLDYDTFGKLGRKRRDTDQLKDHHVNNIPSARKKKQDIVKHTKRFSDCSCNSEHCWTDFPVFVFEPSDGESDLFTAKAMKSMCKFNKDVILPKRGEGNAYCPTRSLAEYVAILSNRKSCEQIEEADMIRVTNLLEACAIYAVNVSLFSNTSMRNLPPECTTYIMKYVREIIIYLTDKQFFNNQTLKIENLRYTAAFPYAYYKDETDFYHKHLEEKSLDDGVVKITAVRFHNYDVKWDLLGQYLIEDLMYFGLALALVFFIMLLYLRSVVLMFVTILSVLVSFVTAYFIYFFIFQMKFFPFLNLLALLVLIAVGADDVFVFYDCWEQAKALDPNQPIYMIMTKTFSHAALSVFVTSLTTASAFFANIVSDITSIQCFGIFAGTSILANFFFMVTLTPSAIVCIEWFYRMYMQAEGFRSLNEYIEKKITSRLHSITIFFFDFLIPIIISKTWFIWIILLLALGIGANIAVFVYPRLQLPVTTDFQVFPPSNLIENWDLTMGSKFMGLEAASNNVGDSVTFYFIWGVQANDPGNWLDPKDHRDRAPLIMDDKFDFAKPEVQTFLLKFCHELLKQPFMPEVDKVTCQLDAITQMMKKYCSNPLISGIIGKCCTTPSVPFDPDTLSECAAAYQLGYNNRLPLPPIILGDVKGDLVFDNVTNEVKAYVIPIHSQWLATLSYEKMAEYNEKIMGFFNQLLKEGPPEVQNGFVAYQDWFWFYDLQHALATSTYYSIGLSLGVACIVMLLTSLNVLISIYAIATICLAIACTVATIVFMGWHLNIIESIIISLAVGLSIDFTIHYGVAYRLSKADKSNLRTKESFKMVGAAVAMAALTTFIAGAAMMPCRVLPYTKLGIFLMLVMMFSWLYANFFFQSICHIIGPRGNICQITCSCCDIRKERAGENDGQTMNGSGLQPVTGYDTELLYEM